MSTVACESQDNLTEKDFDILLETLNSVDTSSSGKQRRRVHFNPYVSWCSKPSPLFFDEVKELWYDANMLASFKEDARHQILRTRQLQQEKFFDLTDDEDETAEPMTTERGLENYTGVRQQFKRGAIRWTVRCYQYYQRQADKKPEDFARVVQRFTSWSRKVALLQGCRDYCTIYRPAALPKMMKVSDMLPPAMCTSYHLSSNNQKRSFTECTSQSQQQQQQQPQQSETTHQNDRCVRRRLSR